MGKIEQTGRVLYSYHRILTVCPLNIQALSNIQNRVESPYEIHDVSEGIVAIASASFLAEISVSSP